MFYPLNYGNNDSCDCRFSIADWQTASRAGLLITRTTAEKFPASRIDAGLAYLIAALALGVQGIQRVYRIRVAHFFTTPLWHYVLMILVLGMVAIVVLNGFALMQGSRLEKVIGFVLWTGGVLVWIVGSYLLGAPWWVIAGGVVGLFLLPAYAFVVAYGGPLGPL